MRATKKRRESTRILPLADPVVLVVNKSRACRQAQAILDDAGVTYELTSEIAALPSELPLLMFKGIHKGLDAIEKWVRFMQHWSKTFPDSYLFAK